MTRPPRRRASPLSTCAGAGSPQQPKAFWFVRRQSQPHDHLLGGSEDKRGIGGLNRQPGRVGRAWVGVFVAFCLVASACGSGEPDAEKEGEAALTVPDERESDGGVLVLGGVPGEGSEVAAGGEIAISWPSAAGAEGYEVQWRSDDEDWGDDRRAVVLGLSYAAVGLDDGVRYQVRVQPAVVEVAEASGARISAGEGSSPRARIVNGPPGPMLSAGGDVLESVAALDGVVEFEMGDAAVRPATIEIPLDMSKVGDSTVGLAYYDDELELWLFEPGATVDREQGVITAEVYHLTDWTSLKCTFSPIICAGEKAAEWVCERICSRVIDGVLQLYEGGKWVAQKLVHGAEVVIDGVRYGLEYGAEVLVDGAKWFWNGTMLVTYKDYRYAEWAIRELIRLAEEAWWNQVVTPITGLTRAQCGEPALIYDEADGRPDTGPPDWAMVTKKSMDSMHICKTPDSASRARISMKSNRPYLNMVQVPKAAEDIEVETQHYEDIWKFLGDTFGHTGTEAEENHQILLLPGKQINYSLSQPERDLVEHDIDQAAYNTWRLIITNLLLAFVPGGEGTIEEAIETVVSIRVAFDDCIVEIPVQALKNIEDEQFKDRVSRFLEAFLECHDSISSDQGYDAIKKQWEALGERNQPTQKNKTRINGLSRNLSKLTKNFKTTGIGYFVESGLRLLRYTIFGAIDDIRPGKRRNLDITLAPRDSEPETPTQNGPSDGGQQDPPTGGQGTGEGVLLTVGGPAQGQPGCSVVHCRHLRITLPSDWLEGRYTVECWSDQNTGPWSDNRPWQWPDAPFWTEGGCWYGGPGHKVWVTVTGEGFTCRSNTLTWPTAPATTAPHSTPAPTCTQQPAAPASATANQQAIAAGGYHSCAIGTDQTISCWGDNDDGQLDAPAGRYTAIAVGFEYSCALGAGQAVTCWGRNDHGQLDAPAGRYIAIEAGDWHSCAIGTDQAVTCWGRNDQGQLDAPAGRCIAIAAGLGHSCAIRADQTISCWGDNDDGQLDAPAGRYIAIAAGDWHSCAIRAGQAVACWGANDFGKIDAPAGRYTAIAVGWEHSCALGAGQAVACWGDNDDGQLDAPAGRYIAIEAGDWHSCAIGTDQTVTCWGRNDEGQIDAPAGRFGP